MDSLNILVTSGGTSERIDRVRKITNSSTGKLGCAVAEAFSADGRVGKIWYVHGASAFRPERPNVENVPVESAEDLERAVVKLCSREKIDAVVHAMAVSDYYVNAVTTVGAIAASVEDELELLRKEGLRRGDEGETPGFAERLDIAVMGARPIEYGSKISSDISGLVLLLRKTPKVLAGFRGMLPDSVIIGFKLLDRVSREFLIDTAHELLLKNSCDFVLANDLDDIHGESHVGYLVRKDKGYETFGTKCEIAAGIVRAVMNLKA